MRQFSVLFLIFVIGGCAKAPESIAPAYVSPEIYKPYNCDQLAQEQARVSAALAKASQAQEDARSNDIVGVIFLGLPVSTLSGGNVAHQVAQLKGAEKTLRQVMNLKQCAASKSDGRSGQPAVKGSGS